MKARDFVRPDERVIVIFTRGGRFEVRSDHTGSTGNWTIDAKRPVDRVIVYHRDESINSNAIYLASFVQAIQTDEGKRYNIELAHVQYAGQSDLNWQEFAETQVNPVRYLP